MGGSPTGACGFAIGMERLVEIFEANSREQEETLVDLYFAHTGRDAKLIAIKLCACTLFGLYGRRVCKRLRPKFECAQDRIILKV